MSVQFQAKVNPSYLAVRFTGAGTAEEVWRQFELIAERCKRANKNKLLLNFTEAHGKISLAERYFLGRKAQIFPSYMIKVAMVDTPERVDPRRFGELVLRNRWVDARVFTNVEDAEEWLLK
jgi:hypothetical protein